MKVLLTFLILCYFSFGLRAQTKNVVDYEIKVVSDKYKTVRGHLIKVNAEGIAVEDYKGNYIIYRPADMVRLRVKKRGLSFGEAVGGGTLLGLGAGTALWKLDESGENGGDMAKLAFILTATGAVAGTLVGAVAEIIRGRLTLNVNNNTDYFRQNHARLTPYIYHTDTVPQIEN